MRGQTYIILSLIIIIFVAIFAIVNVDPVEVNFLFWSGSSPLILVILFSVLMGGLITAFTGLVKIYKLQREIKRIKRENEELKGKLKEQGFVKEDELEIKKESK